MRSKPQQVPRFHLLLSALLVLVVVLLATGWLYRSPVILAASLQWLLMLLLGIGSLYGRTRHQQSSRYRPITRVIAAILVLGLAASGQHLVRGWAVAPSVPPEGLIRLGAVLLATAAVSVVLAYLCESDHHSEVPDALGMARLSRVGTWLALAGAASAFIASAGLSSYDVEVSLLLLLVPGVLAAELLLTGLGSPVFAGTINLDGLLQLEVKSVGSDTALGRVIELLQEAEDSKAPITRLLERYAAAYLPLVLVVAAIVLFTTGQVERSIAVLVVACPCALVLSGPVAMVAALAVASRWGILIKGSSFLERVSEVDTVVLDKTGTVTLGTLSVLSIHPAEGVEPAELLEVAGCCGHGSLHPASRAAAEAARAAGIEPSAPSRLREEAGQGVEAETEAGLLRLGRASWLAEKGLQIDINTPPIGIAVYAARGEQVLGWLELADTPRPEAAEALAGLRALGAKRLVLLTGDREAVAAQVAEQLGFDAYEAEVLPERKAELVAEEQAAGRRVMMVGDGVNDALALQSADVGVAVGAVINEVALGGADIALMGNNLARLPQMVELANNTRRAINLNVLVGGGFSVLMLTIAAAGLINPMLGALLHNGGAIFVVANSARLLTQHDSATPTEELLSSGLATGKQQ